MFFFRVQYAAVLEKQGLQAELHPITMSCILIKTEEIVYMEVTLFKKKENMCHFLLSYRFIPVLQGK